MRHVEFKMVSSVFAGQHVVVTGGAGFIGSHVVERLIAEQANVTVLDNGTTGDPENLRSVEGDYDFVDGDVLDADVLGPVIAQADAIFHFAASAYVPPSVDDPEMDLMQNCVAVLRILEAARRSGRSPRVVIMSSAAVYGDPVHLPVAEDDPLVPISPYGVSKLAAERYAEVYASLHGLPTASLRLFSAYGPRQKKQIVYDFFVKLTTDPASMQIIGDGGQRRDMVFVDDVASAAMAVAERGPMRGEVYNVASGVDVSTLELARELARVYGKDPEFTFTGAVRPGDAQRWSADTTRLRALNWTPGTDLSSGLARTAEWFASTYQG